MNEDNMFVYAAAYQSEADAHADLEAFKQLASKGMVGDYDTAIVLKKPNGKVSVEKHGTPTKKGTVLGAVTGAVVGFLFPPSILMGALVGGAAGAISGKLWGGMSRSQLKDLGEILDEGQSGLIIIGESKLDEYVEKSLKRALRKVRHELNADMKELEKSVAA